MTAGLGPDPLVENQVLIGTNSVLNAQSAFSDYCQERQIFTAIAGFPAWKDPELDQIALSASPARALIEGYARFGIAVLDRIRNAFAVALYDEKSNRTLLAVDRNGIQPLYYACTETGIVFGSTLDAVVAHPQVDREIDLQGIYNYLYFHVVPGPRAIYKNIFRLQPGQYACFEKGTLKVESYWRPVFQENTTVSQEQFAHEFLPLLRSAVKATVNGTDSIGAFLSGGTDSSTVAGLLREVTGEPPRTYSIGFDAEGYDEMEYARIAARHFATEHHEYYVTPEDVVSAIPKVAACYDQPFGNASAIPAYYCACMAKEDGVEVLLGGDGGDELFGGNYRYAKQQLFAYYANLPLPLKRILIEPVLFSFPYGGNIGPVRKLRNYVRQAGLPMPERMETYNLLDRLGSEHIFSADCIDHIDRARPLNLLKEEYGSVNASNMINRMLALDMRFTIADNDLPKVSKMCELAGVQARYPLLDDDIVAFAARLPPRFKVKGNQLRYFFKWALRDFLPPEIQTKKKHGFGLPFGLWLQTHPGLKELAWDSLDALKNRNLIRASFVDELINERHGQHAAYYGTMIWILMMLEQWLTAHQRD